MNRRTIAYWTATCITAFVFVSGGIAWLAGVEAPLRDMLALGYPAYFVTLVGGWKVLGGIAILAPRTPLLKEWAYAGIVFDLTGGAFSQLAAGQPVAKAFPPLAILVVAVASWALRPRERRLGSAEVQDVAGLRSTVAGPAGLMTGDWRLKTGD